MMVALITATKKMLFVASARADRIKNSAFEAESERSELKKVSDSVKMQ